MVTDGAHVGHRIRCGAQTMAHVTGTQHCGVIVAAKQAEQHENAQQHHDQHLHHQDHQQRQAQLFQLPELQAHHRHGQEHAQADVAHRADRVVRHLDDTCAVVEVTQDDGNEHRTDIHRQDDAQVLFQGIADPEAEHHDHQHAGQQTQQHGGIQGHARGFVGFFQGLQSVNLVGFDRQLFTVDQVTGHRAAKQAAGDHTESRRGQRGGSRTTGTEALGNRSESRRGTKAAFQRHSTGHDPQQRIDAEQFGHTDTHYVLQQGQAPAGAEVDEQDLAALAQQAKAAAQTDGGEERHHQRGLHRGVELDVQPLLVTQQPHHQGKAKAADHRGRYTELTQPVAVLFQLRPQRQQHKCQGDGGQCIELQGQHG
ncbi:hypothetical protein D9M71_408920 [compost metagenome]